MSSLLNTIATTLHVSPIPSDVAPSKCIELLHSHKFVMDFNPHMAKYEPIATPSKPVPTIPEDRKVTAIASPECYRVTDRVSTLPAGLWNSDVLSTYEFISIEKGVFVRIRSPLNTVMETIWHVRDTETGASELVEDVVIKCSRLLVSFVKGQCDGDWKAIHDKMMAKLKEES